jgi:hypothetical protein
MNICREEWKGKVAERQQAVEEARARGQALLQRAGEVLVRAEQRCLAAWESINEAKQLSQQTQRLVQAVRQRKKQNRDSASGLTF